MRAAELQTQPRFCEMTVDKVADHNFSRKLKTISILSQKKQKLDGRDFQSIFEKSYLEQILRRPNAIISWSNRLPYGSCNHP